MAGFFSWERLSCYDDSLSIYALILFSKTFFGLEEISAKCLWSIWMCHLFIGNFIFLKGKLMNCFVVVIAVMAGGSDLWAGKVNALVFECPNNYKTHHFHTMRI